MTARHPGIASSAPFPQPGRLSGARTRKRSQSQVYAQLPSIDPALQLQPMQLQGHQLQTIQLQGQQMHTMQLRNSPLQVSQPHLPTLPQIQPTGPSMTPVTNGSESPIENLQNGFLSHPLMSSTTTTSTT